MSEAAEKFEPETATFQVEGEELVAKAFNRWLDDDYEKNPEKFEHTWATVRRHLKEKSAGEEPSYGESCVEILNRYIDELAAEEAGESSGE